MEQFNKEIGKYVDAKEVKRLARYVTIEGGWIAAAAFAALISACADNVAIPAGWRVASVPRND